MGRNVVARQDGDDYQAKFFWLKACGLNLSHTKTSEVAWEADSTFGFDDVTVTYDPAILESGTEVIKEYYQVKFHVDHRNGFTCQAFIDPEFIGATKESLLQRLYKIYHKTDPKTFAQSRYYVINAWGIDHTDECIGELLSNVGSIRAQTLFSGGENSKFGKVRALWKKHLEITSDEELKKILGPLRIRHNYDDEHKLKETLNTHLLLAGLKPIPADQLSSKYGDLIQKLHKAGKSTFTKKELLEICEREELLRKEEQSSDDTFVIGVRSFQKGAENLQLEVHTLLCLLHYFSDRFILEEYSWSDQIGPELKLLSEKAISAKRPIRIHLDTHLSVALFLGYCLDVKYGGLDVTIVQKTFNGKVLWKPVSEKISEYNSDLWQYEETDVSDHGVDTVLSLSVTHDVRANVEEYVSTFLPSVGKNLHATILPKANFISIKDASHIVAAVQEIVTQMRKVRKIGKQQGSIHLFMAAPNAFAFFLGQYIKPLGKVILYEYDFDNKRNGSYHPVITLP
jgi:hypothetical protein